MALRPALPFLFGIAVLVAAPTEAADPVVGVYTELAGGRTGQGTAFFISPNRAVTVYHVIRGATRITVSHEGRQWRRVTVDAIYPEADLAVLNVADAAPDVPVHRIAKQTQGAAGREVTVVGFARGVPNQLFRGNLTQAGFLRSEQLRDPSGRKLFKQDGLSLLPLDITVYSGLSGSPVILDGHVIGVLSGSLHEGRALTWAIPMAYVDRAFPVRRPAADIPSWPELYMTEYWRSLNTQLRIDRSTAAMLDEYFASVDALAVATDESLVRSNAALPIVSVVKAMMHRSAGPASKNDLELAYSMWEANESKVLAAGAAIDAHGVAEVRVRNAIMPLLAHLDDLDKRTRTPRTLANYRMTQQYMAKVGDWRTRLEQTRNSMKKRLPTNAEQVAGLFAGINLNAGTAVDLQKVMGVMEGLLKGWNESARDLTDLVLRYREMGTLIEGAVYLEAEPAQASVRYTSRNGYSLVLPAGWVPLSRDLYAFLNSFEWHAWYTDDAQADFSFAKTGFFGDRQAPVAIHTRHVQTTTISNDLVEVIEDHKERFFALPGVRAFQGRRTSFGNYPGVVVEAQWGEGQAPGRVYAAMVVGPKSSIWVRCIAAPNESMEDCRAAANSVRFH